MWDVKQDSSHCSFLFLQVSVLLLVGGGWGGLFLFLEELTLAPSLCVSQQDLAGLQEREPQRLPRQDVTQLSQG